jgi:teichoic acid transport system permease protein
MTDIAVTESASAHSLASLAARHDLRPSMQRPNLVAYTRQLWAYRYFIGAYATGRLVASFSAAKLGRLWQLLTPLTNAAVYYLIFGVVLGTRDGVPNFVPYLCTGLFIFIFTQTAVTSGVQAISGNLGLIRALHFPRACLPLAMTLTQFQNVLASMVVLAGIVLATGEPLTVKWLLAVPALLLQSVFNAGVALAVARLGSKFTDLKQLMPFIMRTWMYASGVLYSVEKFTEHLDPIAAEVMRVNPLLVYIELMRDALVASAPLATSSPLQLWLLGTGWALLAWFGGYIYFWLGEKEYGRG